MRILLMIAAVVLSFSHTSFAGGVLGDVIRAVPGGRQLGDNLDDAHRRLKEAVPPYRRVEEGGSAIVRKGVEEFTGETAGPVLGEWIRASRGNVIRAGVGPIPQQIQEALRGFIPDHILGKVRYRSGWGNEVALPALSFRFGDAAAITLDDVVMFRSEQDAQTNPVLWAHELTHVMQYERWGVLDFAKRYVKDFHGVEHEAEDNESRYVAWSYQRSPNIADQGWTQQTRMQQSSNICRTAAGACYLPGYGAVGVPCYCGTMWGPVWGAVSP